MLALKRRNPFIEKFPEKTQKKSLQKGKAAGDLVDFVNL